MCCEAVTHWIEAGEPTFHKCSIDCADLCSYHRKMQQGLTEPCYSDEKQNRPVRVEAGGAVLWSEGS